MKFTIAIEPGDATHAFGVVVPDLPACFSVGDTLDEALQNAHETVDIRSQTMIEDGLSIPNPHTLAEHQSNSDLAGWVWALVDVPVEKYLGPAEKINLTVPRMILSRIDEFAKKQGMSRSGFLVASARAAMHA